MVKLCLVCSAEQSIVHPNRSFHKIPKDAYKKQKWLDSIGRKSSYNGAVICSDHFSPDDFFPREGYTILPRLRSSAIPTLNKKDNSIKNANEQDKCGSNEADNKELVQNEAETYNTFINDHEIKVTLSTTENQSNYLDVLYEDIPIDIVTNKIMPSQLNCVEDKPRNQISSIYLDYNVSYDRTLIDYPIDIVDQKIIPLKLDGRDIKPRKRKKELLEMFLHECKNLKIRRIQMQQYATIKETGLGIEEKIYTIL